VLAVVGFDLCSREQIERLIEQVKRIAGELADKNQADIKDRIEDFAERIGRALSWWRSR
jgi:DNA-binding transcriptional regulator GbsR (MarR family)